jgi:hypothetical protein
VEGLEVDLFIGDEDVAIDAVEWQHSSGEDIGLLEHGFF